MTKQQLQTRLEELTAELGKGKTRLRQLEQERLSVEQTLLRIDGAMQLLKEILESESEQDNDQVKPVQSNVETL